MILARLWHRIIHTHLGLFQQVRSEARTTLMPKQLVGHNTITYVIKTDLPFCSKPKMFESHNSMIVFMINMETRRLSYSIVLETMRYTVIHSNQPMNQIVTQSSLKVHYMSHYGEFDGTWPNTQVHQDKSVLKHTSEAFHFRYLKSKV